MESSRKRSSLHPGWIAFTVLCLVWYYIVAQKEGGTWIFSRFAALSPFFLPCVLFHMVAAVGGGLASYSLCSTKRPSWRGVLPLGCFFGIFFLVGTNPWFEVMKTMPDWFSVLQCGSTMVWFSLGYSFTRKELPLWPVLVVPVFLIVYTSITSANTGFLVGVFGIGWLSCGIGSFVIARLVRSGASSIPAAGAAGLATLIFVTRISGAFGGAGKGFVVLLLVVMALASRKELKEHAAKACNWLATPRAFSLHDWALIGFLAGFAFVFWICAIGPEVGPDAIGGRSSLPVVWARSGKIAVVPEIFLSYMGIGGEILNLVFYPFAGDTMAKASTLVSSWLLLGVFLKGTPETSRTLKLWVTIMFFTSTVVAWQFIHGFVDMHVAMMAVVSVALLDVWRKSEHNLWLFVSGALAGTAITIKLNAGSLVPVTLVVLVGFCWRKKNVFSAGFWYLTGVVTLLLPSLVRTWIATGNPVFPFANSVFHSPLAETKLKANLYGSSVSWESIFLPFRMVLEPRKFNELGTYHPLFWCLVIGSVLWMFQRKGKRHLWVVCAFVWLGWLLTEQNIRYSIPAFALTAYTLCATPATAFLWERLNGWAFTALLFIGSALDYSRPTAWMWAYRQSGSGFPFRYASGEQSAEDYNRIYLPSSVLAKQVNDTYAGAAVIWQMPFLRNHLSFLGRTVAHPHGILPVTTPLWSTLPDQKFGFNPEMDFSIFRDYGLTHIIMETINPWMPNIPESEWTGIYDPKFTAAHMRIIGASGSLRLYLLERDGTPPPVPVASELPESHQLQVTPGDVLGFQIDWHVPLASNTFVNLVWIGKGGNYIYAERVDVNFAAKAAWHRYWQSAPSGAAILRVDPNLGNGGATLRILRMPNGK